VARRPSAGLVGKLRADPTLTRMNGYSVELYRDLERSGHPVGWVESGGIKVASSSERLAEIRRCVPAMSRGLGVQFAREGIRVNAVCPGPINTPLPQELFAKDPERAARRMVHIPMGRFGEADEIAAAVAFLASDDASFITASSFLVDGGLTAAYVTPL
jgi:NAD(P)-dependent dehydrogenase (short-subunit alcohol dehydrogenase family)